MLAGRPSRLRRSVGLSLARSALWRTLALRGSGAQDSLAVLISNGGMNLAGGSAGMFGGRSRDVPEGFRPAPASDQRRPGRPL
jgi:hypothetical protein